MDEMVVSIKLVDLVELQNLAKCYEVTRDLNERLRAEIEELTKKINEK